MTTPTRDPLALQIVAIEADVCAYCTRSAVMGQEQQPWLSINLLTSSIQTWAGRVRDTAPQDRTKLELRRAIVCPGCVNRFYDLAFGPLDEAIEVAKKSLTQRFPKRRHERGGGTVAKLNARR